MLKDKKRICVFCGSSLGNNKLIQNEVIKLAKRVEKQSNTYKKQLSECKNSLSTSKYIIF